MAVIVSPVVEVAFFEVACDEPECGRNTGTESLAYAAWADRDQAVQDWLDGDGVVLNNGRAYCREHVPPSYCGGADDERHVMDEGCCELCGYEP